MLRGPAAVVSAALLQSALLPSADAAIPTAAAAAAAAAAGPADEVSYSNVRPRRDTAGNIIDAHDGNYVYDGVKWWYFAMGYGLCADTGTINGCDQCGGSWNNTVGVWSNQQLRNDGWEKAGEVLPVSQRPERANCTWYRSHGVYSKFTKKWVVWINAQNCEDCLPGQPACYITATSDTPAGPYDYTGRAKTLTSGGKGDMDLFTDDDGTGYVVMTRIGSGVPQEDQRRALVERLAPDFLSGVAASTTFGPSMIEAPTLFRRGTTYYVLTGGCTCFGLGGAGVVVNTAETPLGPWTTRSVRLDPGCPVTRWPHCANPSCTAPGDGTCSMHGGPPPPPLPMQNHTGPWAVSFCGGVGGISVDRGGLGERQVILSCEAAGAKITNISFAAYGTFGCEWDGRNCVYNNTKLLSPTGGCSDAAVLLLANHSCNLANARETAAAVCVGQRECTLNQGPPTFPDSVDPCEGIFKSLFVRAECDSGRGHVTVASPEKRGTLVTAASPPHGVDYCVPVTQAQQNYVIRVGGSASGSNASHFIWTGDRWQTGANNTGASPPGLKGWDYQFWAPLVWNESAQPPIPMPLKWLDNFSTPQLEPDVVSNE